MRLYEVNPGMAIDLDEVKTATIRTSISNSAPQELECPKCKKIILRGAIEGDKCPSCHKVLKDHDNLPNLPQKTIYVALAFITNDMSVNLIQDEDEEKVEEKYIEFLKVWENKSMFKRLIANIAKLTGRG